MIYLRSLNGALHRAGCARLVVLSCLLVTASGPAVAQSPLDAAVASISPMRAAQSLAGPDVDWLIRPDAYKAEVYRTQPTSGDEQQIERTEIVMSNGLIRRVWRVAPNGACVAFDDLMTGNAMLRAVRPEAEVTINGKTFAVGGLVGQTNHAYLAPSALQTLTADPAALQLRHVTVGEPQARFAWNRKRSAAPDTQWPPPGVTLHLTFAAGQQTGAGSSGNKTNGEDNFEVTVHYQMYDGVPLLAKWLTIKNTGTQPLTVNRFRAEDLAAVEQTSWVETRSGVRQPTPQYLHVETDFAFGGFQHENANRHVVHWRTDPEYNTQVNYERQTPCLLAVEPTYGPRQTIEPGATFESFRTFELVYGQADRERRGLALRRMYRTIAPWVTENPIMHHMRTADQAAVRKAIEQAAEVGFEMIILSFGSGFQIENRDPNYLQAWKEIADDAHRHDIELGAYSLLSSRRIGNGNDIVSPDGQKPTHGNCPALTSEWGRRYMETLYAFYQATGFDALEHDGPYPGDVDVTARPPWQHGIEDSRWVQWRIVADFYRWCRGKGIYINAPDYYFLVGTNKCGMGYREVNWSLPRAQQVIHTRQNIFDGTWTKTPSMGWMFVPLTEYHGGGAAATIEPLDQHRDHYARMLTSNFGFGVQACYRGPRLYDTAATRALVQTHVAWFKKYRTILESDVVHGRRADGRDLDWMLHVNPSLPTPGMLVVYNPLPETQRRTIPVDLYYTGLTQANDRVDVWHEEASPASTVAVGRDNRAWIDVAVPPASMTWYRFTEPPTQ